MLKILTSTLLMLTLFIHPLLGEEPTTTETTPATQDVIAVVMDKPIYETKIVAAETEFNRKKMDAEEFAKWQLYSRKKLLLMAIRAPLLKAFAEREGLMPTKNDRTRFDALQEQLNKTRPGDDTAKTPKQRELHWQIVGEGPIIETRTAHALWKTHGGSVGFGSLGSCVAFEAEHIFLKGEIKAGRLAFKDAEIEKLFWLAASDEQLRADVLLNDEERIAEMFEQLHAMQ